MFIYICSPFRATPERTREQHIADAHLYCAWVVARGHYPIAPHLVLPNYLDEDKEQERIRGMHIARSVLYSSDAVLVCGPRISEGMEEEIWAARLLHRMPIWQIDLDAGMTEQEPFDFRRLPHKYSSVTEWLVGRGERQGLRCAETMEDMDG